VAIGTASFIESQTLLAAFAARSAERHLPASASSRRPLASPAIVPHSLRGLPSLKIQASYLASAIRIEVFHAEPRIVRSRRAKSSPGGIPPLPPPLRWFDVNRNVAARCIRRFAQDRSHSGCPRQSRGAGREEQSTSTWPMKAPANPGLLACTSREEIATHPRSRVPCRSDRKQCDESRERGGARVTRPAGGHIIKRKLNGNTYGIAPIT